MSSYVFPVLPGRDVGVARETIYKVAVAEAVSGREDRTILSSSPRYRFPLKHNYLRTNANAPAPWASYTELAVVQFFLDAHYGNGDSFHIVDPYDGTTDRVVRFVDGTLRLERVTPGWWRCEFDLISVL